MPTRASVLPRRLLLLALACAAAGLLGAGASAGTAAAAPVEHDVRYGPRPAQTLDIHVPPQLAARRPAVLLVHGGGWITGDKSRLTPLAGALAESGFVVFNVNYTLASHERPGSRVQLADLRAALGWAEDNAASFGADRRRIGALGTSAGGHLAALLATTAGPRTAPGAGALRTVATWSAPLDLATLRPGQLRRLAVTFAGCQRLACGGRLGIASPLAHVSPSSPPMLLVNARRELVPWRQAARMADALALDGVAHELLVVPGALHGRALAPYALAPTISFLRHWL